MKSNRRTQRILITGLALCALLLSTPGVRAEGEGDRGWLGVQLRELRDGEAAELKFEREHGVVIVNVVERSPAAKAGLQADDILFLVNRVKVREISDVFTALKDTKPGTRIGFAAWRDGMVFDGPVVLGPIPAPYAEAREELRERTQTRRTSTPLEQALAAHEGMEKATEANRQSIRNVRRALIGITGRAKPGMVEELVDKLIGLCQRQSRLDMMQEAFAERITALERGLAKQTAEARERQAGQAKKRMADARISALQARLADLARQFELLQDKIEQMKAEDR